LVLLVFVTYGQSSFNVRVFTVSILHLAIYTVIAIRLLRLHDGGVRLQQIVIAVLFLVSAAAMGARGVVSIAGPAQEGLFVSSPSSVIGFFESFIMPICVAIGLLSIVARKTQVEREKTISDLEVALRRVKTLSGLLPICGACKNIREERETGAKWSTTSAIILRWISARYLSRLRCRALSRLSPRRIGIAELVVAIIRHSLNPNPYPCLPRIKCWASGSCEMDQ